MKAAWLVELAFGVPCLPLPETGIVVCSHTLAWYGAPQSLYQSHIHINQFLVSISWSSFEPVVCLGPHLASLAFSCTTRPPLCSWQVDANTPVAIFAEGKEHAMAVGLTKLSTQEMRDVNKGIGVELIHHVNDGLWKTAPLGA